MKPILIPFFASAIILLSCKKNVFPIEDKLEGRILRCEANFEDTTVTTPRLVYTDAGYTPNSIFKAGRVSAQWAVGDVIEFCFYQPSTTTYAKATVTLASANIITGSNKCTFDVTIPGNILITSPYDVYAVTGSSTVTYLNTTAGLRYVNLKFDTTNLKPSLADPNIKRSIVQVARNTGLTGTPNIYFSFKNIGSLLAFAIQSPSNNIDLSNLAISSSSQWLYNFAGTPQYDLQANAMRSGSATTSRISFFTNVAASVNSGNAITMYQWFIPTSNAPGSLTINFVRNNWNGSVWSKVTVPALSGAQPAAQNSKLNLGTRYYINRNYNGTNLTLVP